MKTKNPFEDMQCTHELRKLKMLKKKRSRATFFFFFFFFPNFWQKRNSNRIFPDEFAPYLSDWDTATCCVCGNHPVDSVLTRSCIWFDGYTSESCMEEQSWQDSLRCDHANLTLSCTELVGATPCGEFFHETFKEFVCLRVLVAQT